MFIESDLKVSQKKLNADRYLFAVSFPLIPISPSQSKAFSEHLLTLGNRLSTGDEEINKIHSLLYFRGLCFGERAKGEKYNITRRHINKLRRYLYGYGEYHEGNKASRMMRLGEIEVGNLRQLVREVSTEEDLKDENDSSTQKPDRSSPEKVILEVQKGNQCD